MSKQSGLGDNLYIDGYDVSGDTNSLGRVGGGPAPWECTGIDKFAFERKGLLRDGALEWVSYFNPANNQAHPVLKVLPAADRALTYCRGTALGGQAAALVGKQINYDSSRGNDGSLTFEVAAQANGFGLEWCTQLTAGKRSDSTATDGASVDFGGQTLFGLQAYLQVFAFTGTSVTIKLQDSADNSAWADLTGGAFTAVTTAPGSQRIQTARNATVRRYLRVVTTGTFSAATFSVVIAKNPVEVTF